jgi:UDP-glucose-4-epimerase GalE
VYDSLAAGHREAVRYGPLVEGDIADVGAVRAALKAHHVSAVMHFAAFLDVGESVRVPARYYRNNVVGTLGVLEAMAAEGVTRFVFSSTCATYGDPVETPMSESHPQQPINAYGETKLAIERSLPHFELAYGMKWTALRYFNAAGADPDGEIGEDHSPEIHAIPRAIDAACGGAPFHVFGDDYPTPDGTCLRDYIHVADLADAHVLALESVVRTGASAAYNLGTGQPHSVKEVIAAVEEVSGRRVPWTLGPRRPGDPAILYASARKAEAELGWRPRFPSLQTIVKTAWAWHLSHPRGYRP